MKISELAKRYGVGKRAMYRAFHTWASHYADSPEQFRKPNGQFDVPPEFVDWLENSGKRTLKAIARRLGMSWDTVQELFQRWCKSKGVNPYAFLRPVWTGRSVKVAYIVPDEFAEWLEERAEMLRAVEESYRRAIGIIERAFPDAGARGKNKKLVNEFRWWCELNGYDINEFRAVGRRYIYPEEFIRWLEERYGGDGRG